MKTQNRQVLRQCFVACAMLAAWALRLNADEPQPEATQPPQEVTVPIEITGVVSEQVANLNGVLLQVAGQTDPLLGLKVKPVDEVLRSHLGLPEGKGFVVTAVADESALAKSGIRTNDVLLTVAGEEISSLEMLSKTLRGAPDKSFTIGIIRTGKKESVEIKPGRLEITDIDLAVVRAENAPRYRLGVGLADADETLRSQLSLWGGEGLVVTSVENDSPAAKSGALVNDVLVKLDGKALTSIDALQEQLQTIAEKAVTLELMRRGQPATLTVTPEKLAPAAEQHLIVTYPFPYQVNVNDAGLGVWTSQPNPFWSSVTVSANALEGAKPNADAQVAALLEQVKQLQASLEALQAALKMQPQPAESGQEK